MIHKAILALVKNLYYKYMKCYKVLATYSINLKNKIIVQFDCTINRAT